MKIFVLVMFILTYVLIIGLPRFKMFVTGGSALIIASSLLIFGQADILDVVKSIDYNVVLMLVGIMLTVGMFSESGMPNKLADKMVKALPNTLITFILLSVLSGFISAFIDNVATVLMLAPIGIAIAKKAGVSPIPVIISIAVSSNLQGAATLVGDTTSIMLGGFANMSFLDFFFLDGKLSIFWAVELGALMTIPILYLIFRKDRKKISIEMDEIKVKSIMPTIFLLVTILALIAFSFVPNKIEITNGLICMTIGLISVLHFLITQKGKGLKGVLKSSIDYETVVFLISLFVIIFAVEKVGIIADISSLFVSIGSGNVFLLYTIIVFGSVICSAFIDNIPFVATMLPVIQGLLTGLPGVSPYLLYFGLLCGATLGGNLTPVGASANVVGVGILRKEGYQVKNKDFFKIGIPFTLVAVLSAYLLVWFVWGL